MDADIFGVAAKVWPTALADTKMLQSLLGLLVNLSADSAHAQALFCSAKAWALLFQENPLTGALQVAAVAAARV